MLAIEICILSTENKNRKKKKCILNGAKKEEGCCGGADRGSKGLQTSWLLLLVVNLFLLIHHVYNARINFKEASHH